jgi:hypothetical protein
LEYSFLAFDHSFDGAVRLGYVNESELLQLLKSVGDVVVLQCSS